MTPKLTGPAVRGRAAIMAAVIAAVVTVGACGGGHPAAARGPAPMPPYYLYVGGGNQSGKYLTVRSSADGRALDTVRAPAGQLYGLSSTAAGDRTFLFTVITGRRLTLRFSFRMLRLAASGRVASLTRLPYVIRAGKNGSFPASVALNTAANQLAVAIVPNPDNARPGHEDGITRVVLVSVATGRVLRTWTAPGLVTVDGLSWAGDRLSLDATDARQEPGLPSFTQMRVLNAGQPNGALLTASTVVPLRVPHGQTLVSGQLTPDGRTILAWVSDPIKQGAGTLEAGLLEKYSAPYGRFVRVLYGEPARRTAYVQTWPVAIDASGQHLLIQALNEYVHVVTGRLDAGRFTPLPHARLTDPVTRLLTW